MKTLKIYILNTLDIGIDVANTLRRHLDVKGMIGLSDRPRSDRISGFTYLKPYCDDYGLDFVEVDSYTMRAAGDREKLLLLDIDLLIVAGWQRLIPDWLIEHCRVAALGTHGSPWGITEGRGRSPQNWALLLGMTEFSISIFKIDAGIDSGAVIDTRKFVLTPFDDIKSSYYKACQLSAHMIVGAVRDGRIHAGDFGVQSGEAYYLPQRLPEDGEVDWSRSTMDVYNTVRALTRHYPGSFCLAGDARLTVWRARPFDMEPIGEPVPGEIVRVLHSNDLLVRTGDGFLLIEDYTLQGDPAALAEGVVLSSCEFREQLTRIVERHRKKYPALPIAPQLLALLEGD